MARRILLVLSFLITTATFAQTDSTKTKQKKERKIELYGQVFDSFTKASLKAHLTLMTAADSAVVDTTTCQVWGTHSFYEFKVPAHQEDYIIKGTLEGYEDAYMNYNLRHIARNNHFELPRLLMKKKQDEIWRESELDGVTVVGTRVKIAYRGDTIVYNAAAFNLPEGSMLDGLIRQMPGAELKDNGDIYINGKKVDYLTLNGKDFFKGQNKVMLDNLPYFTVQNIKVYDKSTKQSEMIGHDVEKKDYVMDVVLKREYNRGMMGNVEAGAGTDDRYMARLFALYYDDHTRLSVFGNVNNVNENRKPGGEGEWTPSNMPQGLRTTKMTGMDLRTEDSDKQWEENLNAAFTWSDTKNESRTSSETFANEGNIFGGTTAWNRQHDFSFSARNNFQLNKPYNIMTSASVSYSDGRRNSESRDSTYRDYIINQVMNAGLNRYRTLSLEAGTWWYKKFDWGDYIVLAGNVGYTNQKPSESFTLKDTHYAQGGNDDHREYFADTHSNQYNYELGLGYTLQMPNSWYIGTQVGYKQQRSSNYNNNYRLDWLGNATQHELGWLPSTYQELTSVIDTNNSDNYQTMKRSYEAELEVTHSLDNSSFSLNLPISNSHERMHYDNGVLDTIARRHYTEFTPSLTYVTWGQNHRFVRYQLSIAQPEFASLMPTDDTTNPLAYRENNPGLKSRIGHSLNARLSWSVDSLKRSISVWANASLTQRAWGTRTTYNTATGAYAFRNDNVDGNWTAAVGGSIQHPLDRKRRLTITERLDANYLHSVDFDVLYVAVPQQQTQHPTSTVHNWTLSESLKLEYQHDKLTVSASGHVDYRHADSHRENFQRIRAWDYDYGMTLRYTIPWMKVDVATDLRMFSRRGYYSSMMNDDHLVWNAELSRSLFKGKWTAKVQAFDLLHQLSNTQYNVNAQGRTETWNRCIPRYVMFTLAYKLTQKPKQ